MKAVEKKRNEGVLTLTRSAARVLLRPFFRLETEGASRLPKKGAFILLPKHQRWEDIPLLSLATPRPLYYVAKHELFANPVSNWFLRSLGGLPLNREHPLESRTTLRAVIAHLKEGEAVVVFPEGTYYRNRMGKGNVGVVRLILSKVSAAFFPVGVQYTEGALRTTVHVRFGEPLHMNKSENPTEFLDRTLRTIGELSGLRGPSAGMTG